MFARTPIEFLQCVVFVSHVSVALMCCLSLFRHFRLMSEETSPLLTKFAPTVGSWSKPVFGESLGALLAWMVLIILFIMVILQCTRFCRDTRTPINMDKSPIGRAHCASGQATGLYGIKKKWLMMRLQLGLYPCYPDEGRHPEGMIDDKACSHVTYSDEVQKLTLRYCTSLELLERINPYTVEQYDIWTCSIFPEWVFVRSVTDSV